jgi:hypothetical protein
MKGTHQIIMNYSAPLICHLCQYLKYGTNLLTYFIIFKGIPVEEPVEEHFSQVLLILSPYVRTCAASQFHKQCSLQHYWNPSHSWEHWQELLCHHFSNFEGIVGQLVQFPRLADPFFLWRCSYDVVSCAISLVSEAGGELESSWNHQQTSDSSKKILPFLHTFWKYFIAETLSNLNISLLKLYAIAENWS